jgi:hypothetical protein
MRRRPTRIGRGRRTQTDPSSRPDADETDMTPMPMPRAAATCSGATLSGINAAMPPAGESSASIAPSSTSRSNVPSSAA